MLFQSSSAQRRLLDDVEAKTLGIRLQQLGMLLDALSFWVLTTTNRAWRDHFSWILTPLVWKTFEARFCGSIICA